MAVDTVESMPVAVGVRLGSAALQVLADDAGVDVLHIKGPAVDDVLLNTREVEDPDSGVSALEVVARQSVDVDLLVRPSHIERLFAAMREHDWRMVYRFEDGSPFEHASTWMRVGLAAADVHRTFPGVGLDAEAAFEEFWAGRRRRPIAGYPCVVPALPAQRLILLLHAVRGGDLAGSDVRNAWDRADATEQAEVDALAALVDAEVALAAATGRLARFHGRREYDLWRALAVGERSRVRLWRARVKAQPTAGARLRTAVRLVAPKPGRMRRNLGHEPNTRDYVRAWGAALRAVGCEAGAQVRRTLQRRGR